MTRAYQRVLLLFVDGIGLAPASPRNPFATLDTPGISTLFGAPLVAGAAVANESVRRGLDATLGVEGLPQSATGQTALFTGVNAAAALGRHVPALPGPRLKALLAEHSVFRSIGSAGRKVTFANAFTERYLEGLRAGDVRASATTWSVLAAGIRLRIESDLDAGHAVTWDVTGDLFGRRAKMEAPRVSAIEAGRRLAALALDHDLTLFETFVTDLAGHGRWGLDAADAIGRLDGLAMGIAESGQGRLTTLLVSDHGNLEEDDHRRHTRNPVPWCAVGPLASRFDALETIIDVAPALIDAVTPRSSPGSTPLL